MIFASLNIYGISNRKTLEEKYCYDIMKQDLTLMFQSCSKNNWGSVCIKCILLSTLATTKRWAQNQQLQKDINISCVCGY